MTALLPYRMTTSIGQQVRIDHVRKPYTILLPASYKGHLFVGLILDIFERCEKIKGGDCKLFYTTQIHFEREAPSILGRIVPLSKPMLERTIFQLQTASGSNLEATLKLKILVSTKFFRTEQVLSDIQDQLNKGASEAILLQTLNKNDNPYDSRWLFDLLVLRNGLDALKTLPNFDDIKRARTFFAKLDRLSFRECFAQLDRSRSDYLNFQVFSYKLLTATRCDEVGDIMGLCENLLDYDSLKEEIKKFISENCPDTKLQQKLIQCRNLRHIGEFIFRLRRFFGDNGLDREHLYRHRFYSAIFLFHDYVPTLRRYSSFLTESSPTADIIIKLDGDVWYANSAILSAQSRFFDYHIQQVSSVGGRITIDLSGLGESTMLEAMVNVLLGRKTFKFSDGASRHLLAKGIAFFGVNRDEFDNISPYLFKEYDLILNLIRTRNFEELDLYLMDKYAGRSNFLEVLKLVYPSLQSILQMYPRVEMHYRFVENLYENEKLFNPHDFLTLIDKNHKKNHHGEGFLYLMLLPSKCDMSDDHHLGHLIPELNQIYIERAADLKSSEYNLYLPSLRELLNHPYYRKILKNAFLKQIAKYPSLQDATLIVGDNRYPTNIKYLQLFGGEFLNSAVSFAQLQGKKVEVDVSSTVRENTKIAEVINREVLQADFQFPDCEVECVSYSSVRGLMYLEEYEFLGLDFAVSLNLKQKNIYKLFVERNVLELHNLFIKEIKQRLFVIGLVSHALHNNPEEIEIFFALILKIQETHWICDYRDESNLELSEDENEGFKVEKKYLSAHKFNNLSFTATFSQDALLTLQKLAHRGSSVSYSEEEIERIVAFDEFLPALFYFAKCNPNTAITFQITAHLTLRIKQMKKLSWRESIVFFDLLAANAYNIKSINCSYLKSDDLSVLEYMLKLSNNFDRIYLPHGLTLSTQEKWLIPLYSASLTKKFELVMDHFLELPFRMKARVILRDIRNIYSLPLHSDQDLGFVGYGEIVNLEISKKFTSESSLTLQNYLISTFNLLDKMAKLKFVDCSISNISLGESFRTKVSFIGCFGEFNLCNNTVIDELTLINTKLTEGQLVNLCKVSTKVYIDQLPSLQESSWQLIRNKINFLESKEE